MKRYLEIYDPEKTYIFATMAVATPDIIKASYSAVNNFKCVVETDAYGEKFYAVDSFNSMKDRFGIDPSLSDTEALAQLEVIINTEPTTVEQEPSAEERIASALEYQNLLAM
jgi:hypothetical protein